MHVDLTNDGAREISDVVQVYLHDPVAQVTRPDSQLIAFQRVTLAPAQRASLTFRIHADLTSFTGRDGIRLVEPGDVELRVARSSADVHETVSLTLVGEARPADASRTLLAGAVVDLHPAADRGHR